MKLALLLMLLISFVRPVMRSRAYRRHHRHRMLAHARRVIFIQCVDGDTSGIDHRISRHADNLAICSCPMCGNPRRHGYFEPVLTFAERRADADFREQLRELGF